MEVLRQHLRAKSESVLAAVSGLVVGIAAGLPDFSRNPPRDIRLGDVLVSIPEAGSTGVVQHDMGKQTVDRFKNTSQQPMSTSIIRATVEDIRVLARRKGNTFAQHLERVENEVDDEGVFVFRDPGQEKDLLHDS